MDKKYLELCKDKQGNKVMGLVTQEESSMKISATLFLETPDGERSAPISIPRSKVVTERQDYSFIYDWGDGFSKDAVNAMKDKLMEMFKNGTPLKLVEKASPEKAYIRLAEYIKTQSTGKLYEKPGTPLTFFQNCFIEDEFGYIKTTQLDSFLSANTDLGYKRIELLRVLRIHGYLASNKDRSYDYNVREGASTAKFYRIIMPEDSKLFVVDKEIKIQKYEEVSDE